MANIRQRKPCWPLFTRKQPFVHVQWPHRCKYRLDFYNFLRSFRYFIRHLGWSCPSAGVVCLLLDGCARLLGPVLVQGWTSVKSSGILTSTCGLNAKGMGALQIRCMSHYLTLVCPRVSLTGEEKSVRRSTVMGVLGHHVWVDVDPDCHLTAFHYHLFWMRLSQGINCNA